MCPQSCAEVNARDLRAVKTRGVAADESSPICPRLWRPTIEPHVQPAISRGKGSHRGAVTVR